MRRTHLYHVLYFETPVKYSKLYLNQILNYRDFEIT